MHIALDFREEASLVTREEEEERVLLVTFLLGTLYIYAMHKQALFNLSSLKLPYFLFFGVIKKHIYFVGYFGFGLVWSAGKSVSKQR